MSQLPKESLDQLFAEARSFSFWQNKEIADETIRELYELLKWGPTTANGAPA